jgi:hypothetical protein
MLPFLLATPRIAAAEPPTAGFPAPEGSVPAPALAPPAAAAPPALAPSAPAATPGSSAPPPTAAPPRPPAAAPPAGPVDAGVPPLPRDVSLTVSVGRLLLPMAEVEAEIRIGSMLGLAAFGGAGVVSIETEESGNESLTAYEFGAKVLVYPIEPFENLELGAEFLYVNVSSDDLGDDHVEGFATGIAVGPLLGYKTISEKGFTFSVQGGIAYIALHSEASSDTDAAEESDQTWMPLLNLNLGWSF